MIHASFVILSHIFTVNYVIFMHFDGLTYIQDAKYQFSVFAVFLFQKFTFENILGIGSKFTGIIFTPIRRRSLKGSLGGDPRGRGAPLPRPKVDPQVGSAPARGAPPRPLRRL